MSAISGIQCTFTVCTVTERQAIERERAAYIRGRRCTDRCSASARGEQCAGCDKDAACAFPFPKVTRERVVADPHAAHWLWSTAAVATDECSWCSSSLERARRLSFNPGDGWRECRLTNLDLTPERVKLWADLLANPTEEVEA